MEALAWSDLEIKNALGEGHCGIVHKAKLNRDVGGLKRGVTVAVKCYKKWLLEQPGQMERIMRELQTGRRIEHSNLVKTLALILDPTGVPVLVMSFHNGKTLESYLDKLRSRKKFLEVEKAFSIIGGIAGALAILNEDNIIHRDVKPANIIINKDRPILMDFGVVKSSDFPEQTKTGSFLGTIRYAAPEYLLGEEYDKTIDIYSLGSIIFEIFGGSRFLSQETQWARLVALKASSRNQILSFDYKSLENRIGINSAEFIRYALSHTLVPQSQRTLNLSTFSEAAMNRVWNKKFYVINDDFVLGEPKVKYLGNWEKNDPKCGLNDIMLQLSKVLDAKELNSLCKLIEEHYWSGELVIDDLVIKEKLKKIGVIRPIETNTSGDAWHSIHESVLAAYRYGYLKQWAGQ